MDQKVLDAISSRLTELRGAESINSFASRMGIERKTWAELENREHYPSLSNLLLIADNCDVDIDWIVGRSDTRNKANTDACGYTGLSEKAVERLHDLKCGKVPEGFERMDINFAPELGRMELDISASEMLDVIRRCGGDAAVNKLCLSPQKAMDDDFIGYYATKALTGPEEAYDGHPERETRSKKHAEFELALTDSLISDWKVIGLISRYIRTNTMDVEECVSTDGNPLEYDITMIELIKKELAGIRDDRQRNDPAIYSRFSAEERIRISGAYESIPRATREVMRNMVESEMEDACMPDALGSIKCDYGDDGDGGQ